MSLIKNIFLILNHAEKKRAYILFFLMIFGVFFETLGIGLIIPVVSLLMSEDVKKYLHFFGATLSNTLSNYSNTELTLAALFGLATVYVLKALFLCFLSWYQTIFAYNIQARVSKSLLKSYLHQPYNFHLERNSAELIANVSNWPTFLASCLIHGSSLLTETLLIFAVFGLLLRVDFYGTLLAGSFLGIFSFCLYSLVTQHTASAGKKFQMYEGLKIKRIQQALGGVKEILILGRSQNFVDEYERENRAGNRVASYQVITQNIPRLVLESVAIIGLIGLIISMLLSDKSPTRIIETVGVFAVAAFRLMPSATRIINAFHALKYHGSSMPDLYAELCTFNTKPKHEVNTETTSFSFKLSIDLNGVSYQYPRTNKNALEDINLTILKGSAIGIVGQSGSGKSTLVDLMLGLISPTSGQFTVDNFLVDENITLWQKKIGYVPQSIYLADETLMQNIAFGVPINLIDQGLVWEALEAAQLASFVRELPMGLETPIGERGVRLSGGQSQRIGIARALYHQPDVLVLDEATSALDMDTEKEVMNSIEMLHGQKTIVIVAHRLSTVVTCDWIYRLDQGVIVESGPPSIILKNY